MVRVKVGVEALHEGCLAGARHADADDRDWWLLRRGGGGGGRHDCYRSKTVGRPGDLGCVISLCSKVREQRIAATRRGEVTPAKALTLRP